MADRAKKITQLTAITAATGDDLLIVVDDPSGNAATKSISVSNLLANSANVKATSIKAATVATSSANGVAGQIYYDSSFIYVCVATNTWKRASLGTW